MGFCCQVKEGLDEYNDPYTQCQLDWYTEIKEFQLQTPKFYLTDDGTKYSAVLLSGYENYKQETKSGAERLAAMASVMYLAMYL